MSACIADERRVLEKEGTRIDRGGFRLQSG